MALSFPESRDKTADSIVAITINLQLIVFANINLKPDMVSIAMEWNSPKKFYVVCVLTKLSMLVQKVCSELSQIVTLLLCIFLRYHNQQKNTKILRYMGIAWVRCIFFKMFGICVFSEEQESSEQTEVTFKQIKVLGCVCRVDMTRWFFPFNFPFS